MNRVRILLQSVCVGAFALTATFAAAQPPAAAPQPPAAQPAAQPPAAQPAAGEKKYEAQLIAVRPDANRVSFRVQTGGSVRVYNLVLADGAKMTADNQPTGLAALKPNSSVVVTTAEVGGIEKITAITTGGRGAEMAMEADAQAKPPMEPTGGKLSLAFPTGDRATSVLLLESNAPDEVRIGQPFNYQIKVTNVSKNIALENVVISQYASDKIDVLGADAAPAAPAEGQAPAKAPDADRGEGSQRWTIKSLQPGQAMTLNANAAAHAEGVIGSCFRVSYDTALCVRIKVTKPELQLTKVAPEVVRFCEAFTFKYTVTNPGTAAAKNVVVTDTLPEGLMTAENKREITATIPELAPGESKEITAPVMAAGRGQFTSKAVAKSESLAVESRATTTKVIEADLNVTLTAPPEGFVNESATFVATVVNEGDAPAPGSTLEIVMDPAAIRFDRATAAEGAPAAEGAITPDAAGKLTYQLGTINPGETRKATITVTGVKAGAVNSTAIARFVCDRAKDNAEIAIAQAAAKTEFRTIPALRLSLVDQKDLIKVGEEVTYTLEVINQGTGPDTALTLKLTLPPELQYVSSEGSTVAKADGQVVAFGNVETLEPGKTVTWNIKAKALKPADVRTVAELNSAYLKTPVTTTEPTRLIQ